MTVTFGPDHILFASYPFPWASVHPHGIVTAADIRSASWEAGPLEIHSRSGETLFLPWDDRAGLTQFCARHGIPAAERLDVWGNLLELFLDTELGQEHLEATDARLRGVGLPQESIDAIRARFAPLMMSYNFGSMLWEWGHLGLHDLLRALNGELVDPALPGTLGDPAEIYRWAMEVADYGRA